MLSGRYCLVKCSYYAQEEWLWVKNYCDTLWLFAFKSILKNSLIFLNVVLGAKSLRMNKGIVKLSTTHWSLWCQICLYLCYISSVCVLRAYLILSNIDLMLWIATGQTSIYHLGGRSLYSACRIQLQKHTTSLMHITIMSFYGIARFFLLTKAINLKENSREKKTQTKPTT